MKLFSGMVVCAMLLIACDSKQVFEQSESIPNHTWSENAPVKMEFEIKDTMAMHNFFLVVRNGEDYPYSNLYVFVDMEFPNGKKSTDTVECFLADPTGKWYGKGAGTIYDNRILYKHEKRFPLNGRYKITLHQGMREENLPGIYDVGFRLALAK